MMSATSVVEGRLQIIHINLDQYTKTGSEFLREVAARKRTVRPIWESADFDARLRFDDELVDKLPAWAHRNLSQNVSSSHAI